MFKDGKTCPIASSIGDGRGNTAWWSACFAHQTVVVATRRILRLQVSEKIYKRWLLSMLNQTRSAERDQMAPASVIMHAREKRTVKLTTKSTSGSSESNQGGFTIPSHPF
jgi:hypothetical protein